MREIVVVGAGIVGVSVAHALTSRTEVKVTVLERDAQEPPRGSTAYAPGFIGVYNDAPILTELARESVTIYHQAGHGFHRPGGIELATSAAGFADLRRRADAARSAGLRAELLAPSDLPDAVAGFVDVEQLSAAAYFPEDGSADVHNLMCGLRTVASSRGAQFRYSHEVTAIDEDGAKAVVATASGDRFTADVVVLAAGVWGPPLAKLTGLYLPLFPVAHPYVYDAPRTGWVPGPFVRWPEHHVYSRIHGDRLGIGTYDHRPVVVSQDELQGGAALAWPDSFTPVIETAQRLLRPEARFIPERRVDGVFAMTPDNLPFLGRHPELPRVWVAQALWVTHAAGAARRLAAAVLDDTELPHQLRVTRFDGADPASLRDAALRLYRDIYANDGA